MTRRRRGRGQAKPTRLGDLVQETPAGKAAADRVLTRKVWEEVAGVGFARRTRPGKVVRGTLYVTVASAGWAQELALVEKTILERLRARGLDVDRLRFEVKDVEAPERGGVYAPAKAEVERARRMELPEEAARALRRVQDPALRDILAKTALAVARRQAEVDLKEGAAREGRAIPRLPGERLPAIEKASDKSKR